jgi:hypothetical protein
MISYRQADLLPTFKDVSNPCLRLHPFHEKISSQLFAILTDSSINSARFKRNLAQEFPDIKVEDLEKCGVLKWATTLFHHGVRSLKDVKQCYVLFSGPMALVFVSKDARENAREQLRQNRVFRFEGSDENELNGEAAYFGSLDTQSGPIYTDGQYEYYTITKSGSNCPDVVFLDTHKVKNDA